MFGLLDLFGSPVRNFDHVRSHFAVVLLCGATALLRAEAPITAHEPRREGQLILDVLRVRVKICQNFLNFPHESFIIQVDIHVDIRQQEYLFQLADLIVWVFAIKKLVIVDSLTDLKLELLVNYPFGSLA